MVRPGRDKLSGVVEVDETFIGGKKPGKRGRGAAGKVLVGIAVEDKGDEGIGRIRLGIISDASGDSLTSFVQDRVMTGSIIRTDDWGGYNRLMTAGYNHMPAPSNELKLAHLVASLLKRWLLGTHQGAVSALFLKPCQKKQENYAAIFINFSVDADKNAFNMFVNFIPLIVN